MKNLTMAPSRNLEETDASMRLRLVNSLSQSFPGSALSKALQCMQPDSSDDDMKSDPLSTSCFAEIRLDKEVKEELDDDEELTSLSWLQDSDLLKSMNAGETGDEGYIEDGQKENGDIRMDTYPHTHPPHVPYNPQKHINSKPPYSFSCLIFMAVEDSPTKKLPVKDIYNWILTHFPYFQNAPTGWKNSVRHNLSLNKCFKKVDKEKGQSIGKGSLWCIDPDYRPNLLQALRKTPYHPYHQLQMLASPQASQPHYTFIHGAKPLPLTPRIGPNSVSPHLFPFLSRRLAQSNYDIDSDIQDVAQTLVSLKGLSRGNSGSRSGDADYASLSPSEFARLRLKRKQRFPHPTAKRRFTGPIICTSSPSEDHTYSATTVSIEDRPESPESSIDEEYDFGPDDDFSDSSFISDEWDSDVYDEVDGSVNGKQNGRIRTVGPLVKENDAEEQKKIEEGADALLNLAGIRTPTLRSLSPEHSNSDTQTGKKSREDSRLKSNEDSSKPMSS